MIRNSPKRSAKWCASSASAGSDGRSALAVVLAPRAVGGRAVLRQHRVGLEHDRDRPQHVAKRLGHPDRDHEQQRGRQAGERDPPPQRLRRPSPVTTSTAASTIRVAARLSAKAVLSPCAAPSIATAATPRGHAAGEEQQPRRQLLDPVAVVEHREADPRPPQRREQPERDPHAAHLRLGHDQVRDLRDREHEHEVEVELDPGDPFPRLVASAGILHDAAASRTALIDLGSSSVKSGSRPTSLLARGRCEAAAFAGFYAAYSDRVLAFHARRVLDPEVAFDLMSETFAKALERRRQFRGSSAEEEQGVAVHDRALGALALLEDGQGRARGARALEHRRAAPERPRA